ncbi:hypothetical protein KS4_15500 [Poriferisphaera corsica]|uniref:Uncharacterized protein n=1 Tax=Poriferisphaera corsica TaxID=2528020 RepID=A0A517YTD5_9BACT|nr:hypothetical protein [Poriferisphaera corsica]QDU33500.1 hypothetical protein KS4_15500 [Poriferisphaera corsica]
MSTNERENAEIKSKLFSKFGTAFNALTHGAKSTIKTQVLRKDRLDSELYNKRLDICRSCPGEYAQFTASGELYTCGPMIKSITTQGESKPCGCILKQKTQDVKEVCPFGYWPEISSTSTPTSLGKYEPLTRRHFISTSLTTTAIMLFSKNILWGSEKINIEDFCYLKLDACNSTSGPVHFCCKHIEGASYNSIIRLSFSRGYEIIRGCYNISDLPPISFSSPEEILQLPNVVGPNQNWDTGSVKNKFFQFFDDCETCNCVRQLTDCSNRKMLLDCTDAEDLIDGKYYRLSRDWKCFRLDQTQPSSFHDSEGSYYSANPLWISQDGYDAGFDNCDDCRNCCHAGGCMYPLPYWKIQEDYTQDMVPSTYIEYYEYIEWVHKDYTEYKKKDYNLYSNTNVCGTWAGGGTHTEYKVHFGDSEPTLKHIFSNTNASINGWPWTLNCNNNASPNVFCEISKSCRHYNRTYIVRKNGEIEHQHIIKMQVKIADGDFGYQSGPPNDCAT